MLCFFHFREYGNDDTYNKYINQRLETCKISAKNPIAYWLFLKNIEHIEYGYQFIKI